MFDEGDVLHARTRFVNEEFRIRHHAERLLILRHLANAKARSGVTVLAFALMSSHIHLLLRGTIAAIERFYRSFHTALAIQLNRDQGRLGPVVAGRPWIDVVAGETIFVPLRYVHANQREAAAAPTLRRSAWTSHPFFANLSTCPEWLSVHEAALLAGYAPTDAGVAQLVADIERLDGEPIDYEPACRDIEDIRRTTGAQVELATPRHGEARVERPLVARAPTPLRPVLELDLARTAAACARALDLPPQALRSKVRRARVSSARALAILVWSSIGGRPAAEMASFLGISEPAASQLTRVGSKALERGLPHLRRVLDQLEIQAEHLDGCCPALDLHDLG